MTKSIAITVVCCLAILVAADGNAFAQAGSTGGTLGKTDKSVSGGEGQREILPAHRSREAQSSRPAVINLKEHNATWGEFSITLRLTSGNAYNGTWNQGTVSHMTVEISPNSMTVDRRDVAGPNLCRGHYTGTRSPGISRASGDAVIACAITGTTSTWDASW
jgi:hypothetical protein